MILPVPAKKGVPASVVDPDPYWIRIQELPADPYSEYGSGSIHANIG